MMDPKIANDLHAFYKNNLYEDILPFWMKNGIDQEYGGYFTCFNNSGDQLISTDKYVWSQGRMVWLLSKLAETNKKAPKYLELAKQGVNFLKESCFLDNGHCAFLLSREGKPRESVPGSGYDTSIYADCFVALGFAKYASVSKDDAILDLTLQIYDSIIERFQHNQFRTEPEPTPQGYKAHGVPMILLNISQEVCDALSDFGNGEAKRVWDQCTMLKNEILGSFLSKQNIIHELVNASDEFNNSIFERYINPGHSLEDIWFTLKYAMRTNDSELFVTANTVIEKTFEIAWDKEFGGLLHFVDQNGGPPQGNNQVGDTGLLKKLQADWDNKLWWVHAEALYSTLLCYILTNNANMFKLYQKVHDYTFKTFPNSNKEIGEWIQIRDRQGRPIDKVVALPVKDPFHIIRCFINIIELLGN